MIVIEIQIFFSFFLLPPAIFIISSLAMVRNMVAGPVASSEQIVKTLRAIAPIHIRLTIHYSREHAIHLGITIHCSRERTIYDALLITNALINMKHDEGG